MKFYSTFWDLVSPYLLRVFEDGDLDGMLPSSMRMGHVTLIFKKGDPREMAN